VQTFVPELTFADSARVLDGKRLNKQRFECLQMLKALVYTKAGWKRHAAVQMWVGYVPALVAYSVAISEECERRGYADRTGNRDRLKLFCHGWRRHELPGWWGGPIHESHRSRLVQKAPDHYLRYWPDVDPTLEYYWPTKQEA